MAPRKKEPEKSSPKRPPATTPEGRERQLISAAIDLAEKQLTEGTASSQVITHYLKLGSSREKLEQERMGEEVRLLRIKAEAIESQKRVEDLYAKALDAMRSYAGQPPLDEEEDYEEER
jgi:hypothetical protein